MSNPTETDNNESHAIQQRMSRVRSGLHVTDVLGDRVGTVDFMRDGDAESTDLRSGMGGLQSRYGILQEMGGRPEPDVPADLVAHLLRAGYIRIHDARHFRPDHRYYASADQIVSVDDSGISLGVARSDLVVAGETSP